MSDDRPARYEEDGKIIYRASSLGMCDKMFVALAMGYEPRAHPAWFQEILDEGTANEPTIRAMYELDQSTNTGQYTKVVGIGRVVEMEILDGIWIRGSIDGHLDQLVIPTLNEFKKIRDSGWMRYLQQGVEFQANYPMQTSFYMFALGEELGGSWVPMDFTGGHYVQDEKTGDWSITEVHTHHYPDPPVPLLAIKKRIAKLERLIGGAEAIGDIACNINMYPCPMYYLHDEDADEPPTRPSDEIISEIVKQYDALEAERITLKPQLDQIDKAQKELKEGAKAWMIASGQESGDVSTLALDENTEAAVKYLISPRAEYTVAASEQTRVTIRITKREGETVAKAPKKSVAKATKATKKLAPKPGT